VPEDWETYARTLFGLPDAQVQKVTDARRGILRLALVEGGRVQAALFAGPEPVALSRGLVAQLPGSLADAATLAGRPGADRPDVGAIVCSCFNVGVNTILAAIQDQALASVEAIGQALRAGTNCGSCRPELRTLLAGFQTRAAAE